MSDQKKRETGYLPQLKLKSIIDKSDLVVITS